MDKFKQKQVYDILLKPIMCNKMYSKILIDNDIIVSGQKYCGIADEDMCDIAVAFYEIIYKDILRNRPVLDDKGCFSIKEFAGDTMNSFQHIANITPNAGCTKAERTDEKEWPAYLQYYYGHYHCLANFWLIPMSMGRTSKKLNGYDSVDLFLNKLQSDFDYQVDKHKDYFRDMPTFDVFRKIHFIEVGRCESDVLSAYKNRQSEVLINNIMSDIITRADKISKSRFACDLWNMFMANSLIK